MAAKRCKTKENLDTCESWSPLNTTNSCGLIYMKNQPWTKLTEDIRPPFVCPMKKVCVNQLFNMITHHYFFRMCMLLMVL